MAAALPGVLAVMDSDRGDAVMARAARYKAEHAIALERRSVEARAAVAELIEAAKLARSYMEHVEWCSEITNGIDGDCDCGHELHRERVNAALARMGEGA